GRLDSERVYEGPVADAMRLQLRSLAKDAITASYLPLYQSDFAAIREARPAELRDDRDKNVLEVTLHFAIPQLWTFVADEGHYFAQVRPASIESALRRPPNTSAKRSAPLALPYPFHQKTVIDLALPFDLALPAENETIGDDAFAL